MSSSSTLSTPSHPALYTILNFTLSHWILSTRNIKRYYGLDNNVAPRQDIAASGERWVADGKISKRGLERIKRMEAAHLNAVENFPLFMGTLLFGLHAKLPSSTINTFCLAYTVTRIAYAAAYIFIERRVYATVRSLLWAASVGLCFWVLAKSGAAINS